MDLFVIEVSMQVSVESPSKIQRRVTVVVPVEKFDEAYDQHMRKLSKTAKINGFRPGKIPLEIIKQRFGDAVMQEALSKLIETSLYSAIQQEKLNPVDVPRVEPKMMVPGQPIEFVATFDVLPLIDAIHFSVNELEKQVGEVTEADIDRVIGHLQNQYIVWNKVDRTAQEKDQVVIDFKGTIAGVPFQGGEAHDYTIVLGSKMMIPGFEDGLVGMKAGESKILKITFPEDYFAKDVAGKETEFNVKMIKVNEGTQPAVDEAFIKKLGVKSASVDDFRAEIRQNLNRELDRVVKLKLKTQVFDKLLEQNQVEIPRALVEREANRIHNELHPHHKGHDHGHSAAEMQPFFQAAERNVALGILVGEFVKQHDIKPDKERVKLFITNLSSAYENPAEVSKWYMENEKALSQVEMEVLEEQVMEKLLEGVKITEKMLTYNELVSN